ncbi:sugar isomerase domain-containing protein [Miniphocaeibacter halophilus]|uniref:SIS domain-containing protein n=1 Tax=Miniphocaeibacter halophilus TaxID=2931922 RepID=A0AC61MVM2_9FIRM|nr:SIS domain-containing protein [Miniphocaeibacter halophilus]QQK08639.1 SIS domain-containing protein [Miniphocaeibacter halophilus]
MLNEKYFEIVKKQLEKQYIEEKESVEKAAEICAESIMNNRLIHAYGCGHSQMFSMEIFYRAGGLVPVNALLIPHLALFPKAKLSTLQERIEGFSDEYLKLVNTNENDSIIIVSISGRNAAVIDMALACKERDIKVIALTSKNFSEGVESRHSSGKKLSDVADVVIDIKCVKGDAVLEKDGLGTKFCGTSTVLGMFTMQSIIARTVEICVENGFKPPIYVSSNLDEGDEINKQYIKKYSSLIENL